jgi:hypothetical protein
MPGFLEREVRKAFEEGTIDRTRRPELVALQFYLQSLMKYCSEDWVGDHGGMLIRLGWSVK